nr:MAG TPA: hypothetical protein [Caudoviricetes sp.]DAN85208.1 MAG TPA: hypothetical protein [Caudoviricetes sp.]DAZ57487.1 MAG TPA: hypothetical protein [Caudoviricetes sp.]
MVGTRDALSSPPEASLGCFIFGWEEAKIM